jgi:SAM-dependent methyltransferase
MPVLARSQKRLPAVLFTYSPRVRRVAQSVLPILYRGDSVECPCCDHRSRKFIPRHGVDSMCPHCLALQRHRSLALYLIQETDIASGTFDVLHVAPEEGLREKLVRTAKANYVTVDAEPSPIVSVVGDVTALPFPDESFDLVICSHVLEHVQDDASALRELFRVLRPGGVALLPHPVHEDIPTTIEDPAITAPSDRLRMFGATDHVRVYGADFSDRVRAAGFDVTRLDYLAMLGDEASVKYGLGSEGQFLYVATKSPSGDHGI